MNKTLVSVIMPIYNSSKFLENAILSVLNQTYAEFELLLIDDGSTDDSAKICSKFVIADKRVKYFYQNNQGVCSARNLGIKLAQADYICFIDDDDFYEPKFIETMITCLLVEDVDYVKCGRKNLKIKDDKIIKSLSHSYESNVFDFEDFCKNYVSIRRSGILSSIWNGIFKKSIIINNNIAFDSLIKHGNEDIIFNSLYFRFCKKIAFVKEVLYVHNYRLSHSESAKFYSDQIENRFKAVIFEKELIKSYVYQLDTLLFLGCFEMLSMISKATYKDRIKSINIIDTMVSQIDKRNVFAKGKREKIGWFFIKKKWYNSFALVCKIGRML